MMRNKKMLIQQVNYKLYLFFAISIAMLLFAFIPIALAGYVPSRNQKPPSDYSKLGGSRDEKCLTDNGIPLTILAPQAYVGQTVSTAPTFIWFVDNKSEIEFWIFEFISDKKVKQIGQTIKKQAGSSGVIKLSLAQENIKLTVGKKYLWQLKTTCTNDTSEIQKAEFEVVEMSSDLVKVLSTKSDSYEKANLYAEAGFWYDALDEALKLSDNGKLGQLGSTLLQDLAKFEKLPANESIEPQELEENEKSIENRVKNWQQIAVSAE
jgi:hypothetical protein